jgi:hypothetical protein
MGVGAFTGGERPGGAFEFSLGGENLRGGLGLAGTGGGGVSGMIIALLGPPGEGVILAFPLPLPLPDFFGGRGGGGVAYERLDLSSTGASKLPVVSIGILGITNSAPKGLSPSSMIFMAVSSLVERPFPSGMSSMPEVLRVAARLITYCPMSTTLKSFQEAACLSHL